MAGKQQKLKKHSEPSKFVRAEARAQQGQNHEYRHEDVSPNSNKPMVNTFVSAMIFYFLKSLRISNVNSYEKDLKSSIFYYLLYTFLIKQKPNKYTQNITYYLIYFMFKKR
jgi:hypothetical protein